MTATLDGTPRLQRNWDSRAAWNFIGGGAGTGLLLVGAAALPSGWPYFFAGALGFALIGFGLSMVWLEIGRPFRALNVFLHPQTSWMSREALFRVAASHARGDCNSGGSEFCVVASSDAFAGDPSCIGSRGARFGILILPGPHSESFTRRAGVARAKSAMGHYCHWDHGGSRAAALPQLLCGTAPRLGDPDEPRKLDRASRSMGVLPASIKSTSSRSGHRGAEPNLLTGPSSGPRASGDASPRVARRSKAGGDRCCCRNCNGRRRGVAQICRCDTRRFHSGLFDSRCTDARATKHSGRG